MDSAMMTRLLQSYGAANSAENANRIREFYASNPDAAERRAMGLRGGIHEDNTDILQLALDKAVQETSQPQIQQEPLPAPEMPAPAPQRAASAPAPAPRQASMQPAHLEPGFQEANAAPQGVDPKRFGLDDLWMSLLGLSSVAGRALMGGKTPPPGSAGGSGGGGPVSPRTPPEATFVGRMGPDIGRSDPRASGYLPPKQEALPGRVPNGGEAIESPRKAVEDRTTRGNYESVGQEIDQVNNRNKTTKIARENQIRDEVDAENRSDQALRDEMERRARERSRTKELTDAAKRSVGRK